MKKMKYTIYKSGEIVKVFIFDNHIVHYVFRANGYVDKFYNNHFVNRFDGLH